MSITELKNENESSSENERETTWTVRMTADLRKQIEDIRDARGISSKELMATFVAFAESSGIKELQPVVKTDLEELEYHTRRILELSNSVCHKMYNVSHDSEQQLRETIETKQEEIDKLTENFKSFDADKKLHKEEVKQLEEALAKLTGEKSDKEKLYESNAALIAELKEKNKDLSEKITVFAAMETQNNTLAKQVTDLELSANQATIDLERLKKDLQLEQDKALLENEKQHNIALQNANESYNERLQTLMNNYAAQISNIATHFTTEAQDKPHLKRGRPPKSPNLEASEQESIIVNDSTLDVLEDEYQD